MDASKALSILKDNVVKGSAEFQKELEGRFSMINVDQDGFSMYVEEEEVKISGEIKIIRRVFVQSADSDYGGVGWVINEDITSCMICHTAFGMFRWAHHCRSCGNLVCSQCSPDSVIIEELKELGPVRICIMCFWGQDPVHVTFIKQEKPLSKIENISFPSNRHQSMVFVPVFSIECSRLTSDQSKRKIVIHVCLHDVMVNWPDDRDFVVCEDFFESNGFENGEERILETYHVVVRADIVDSTDINLDSTRTKQIADSILAAVAEQFDHRLLRPVMLQDDRTYTGVADRIHLPWHRLDRIPKLMITKSTTLSKPYFVETSLPNNANTDSAKSKAPKNEENCRPESQKIICSSSGGKTVVATENASPEQFRLIYSEKVPQTGDRGPVSPPRSISPLPQLRELEENMQSAETEEEQKRLVGNVLLPIISEYQPEHAQKVVDELLKLDVVKLLQLLQRKQALKILVYDTLVDLVKESSVHSGNHTVSSPVHNNSNHGNTHNLLSDNINETQQQTKKLKKVNSMLSRRSTSADESDSYLHDVALAAERLVEIRQNQQQQQQQQQQVLSLSAPHDEYVERTAENTVVIATPEKIQSLQIPLPTSSRGKMDDIDTTLDFGDIYATGLSPVESRYSSENYAPVNNYPNENISQIAQEEGEIVEDAIMDFGYEHAFEEKKHRTSILLQDDFYQQQTRDSLQAFRGAEREKEERESLSAASFLPMIENDSFAFHSGSKEYGNSTEKENPHADESNTDISFSDIYGGSSSVPDNEEPLIYPQQSQTQKRPSLNSKSLENKDKKSNELLDYDIDNKRAPAIVAGKSDSVGNIQVVDASSASQMSTNQLPVGGSPTQSPTDRTQMESSEIDVVGTAPINETFIDEDINNFCTVLANLPTGKTVASVISAEQEKYIERYLYHLRKFENKDKTDHNELVLFPAVEIRPVPWIVIKSRNLQTANASTIDKVFVNLCHSVALPLLPELQSKLLDSGCEAAWQSYLQQHFVVFTLNKVRHVMHIQPEAQLQSQFLVVDVTVHSQVYLTANDDAALADKLFVKVLKAVSRAHNMDLDIDYKLPRTMKNYKGDADAVQKVKIPRHSVKPSAVTNNNVSQVASNSAKLRTSSIVANLPTTNAQSNDLVSPSTSQGSSNKSSSAAAPAMKPSSLSTHSPSPSPVLSAAECRAMTKQWQPVLRSPSVSVLFSSTIVKRNKLGIGVRRQLILTDEPALFYVDASTMTVKGDIVWTKAVPPKVVKISNDTFDIITDGRTYRMEDQDHSADKWVRVINQVSNNASRDMSTRASVNGGGRVSSSSFSSILGSGKK